MCADTTNNPAAAEHATEEIDIDDQTEFSDYASSLDSDLTSLSSSLRMHVYENGRRYHSLSAGNYGLPNDEPEQERLDMLHHAMCLVLGGALHVVELPEKLDRVLDCGTGTGIWAIQFADEHPESQVIGVDLSPIQPLWVPTNCTFEVDDLEKPWMYKHKFDFINSASLAMGIRDWPRYIKAVYDNLNPNGVAQFLETALTSIFATDDASIPPGGPLDDYNKALGRGVAEMGLVDIAPKLESLLIEAGFVDVKVVIKKIPVGPWAKDKKKKELGRWGLAIADHGLKSFGAALFTRQLGLTMKEGEEMCVKAYEELNRRDVHTYCAQWIVHGRKPAEDE